MDAYTAPCSPLAPISCFDEPATIVLPETPTEPPSKSPVPPSDAASSAVSVAFAQAPNVRESGALQSRSAVDSVPLSETTTCTGGSAGPVVVFVGVDDEDAPSPPPQATASARAHQIAIADAGFSMKGRRPGQQPR